VVKDIGNASFVVASLNQMAHARAEGGQGMFDALFLVDGTKEEDDNQPRS
jgi:hypothetical protein